MDQKGYVISGISFLLIIPAIYLVAVFADMSHTGSQSQTLVIQSDVVSLTVRDIEGNLPFIAERTLQKTANEVIISGNPIPNSRMNIKNNLQIEVDTLAGKYSSQEGINVTCRIMALEISPDPFKVQINSSISVSKGNIAHNENLSQYVSIIDPNYPIPDPLPFIKCKNFGGVTNTSSRIIYGSSLANFLKSSNKTNSDVYINATSPLVIKKCPYDPYITHNSQNNINLKNCIDNGYYHESRDGSCFLCRLEGKGVCSHYGMETFIIPSVLGDSSSFEAPCSSDHVIFDGNYSGYTLTYYSNSNGYYNVFLENGHRTKYGFI